MGVRTSSESGLQGLPLEGVPQQEFCLPEEMRIPVFVLGTFVQRAAVGPGGCVELLDGSVTGLLAVPKR